MSHLPPADEKPITLGKARIASRWALRQWIRFGRKSQLTGELVKLEGWQIGGRLYTTLEAIDRFNARLNGAN